MNWRVLLAGLVVVSGGWATAQEGPHQEDLRFVRELRARHYNDLALEYLRHLSKNAPPALARELPLEFARTRLEGAADEPDTTRRLAEYAQAQAEFEKYLAENKTTLRRGEVILDLAQVAVMRGRTLLSKALLQQTPEARRTEGARARDLLARAGEQLKAAADELDRQLAAAKETTPPEKAAKKKLQADRLRADLSMALNVFDQGQSYSATGGETDLNERGTYFEKAKKALDQLG